MSQKPRNDTHESTFMSLAMLERIVEVPWDSYPRPPYEKVCRIPEALRSVYSANDLNSSRKAAAALTWAIGNDHSGTYYPALLGVLPFVEDLLRNGSIWSRAAVLGFLCDMLFTFAPESGYEEFTDSSGRCINVETEFRAWMHDLHPLLAHLAQHRDEPSKYARELLEEIDGKNG